MVWSYESERCCILPKTGYNCYILICIRMQKHNDDTIKTSGDSSLEKYISHFIERVRKSKEVYYFVRGELETEQNSNILTPTLMAITAFLSRSHGLLNCRPGGPASLGHGSHSSIFSPTDLNFLSLELYNNLTSTYFLRALQFYKVAPDLLISSTGCTCYLHWCIFSFDRLAGSEVNMQRNLLCTVPRKNYEYVPLLINSLDVIARWVSMLINRTPLAGVYLLHAAGKYCFSLMWYRFLFHFQPQIWLFLIQ